MEKITLNAYQHAKFLIKENQKIVDAYENQESPLNQEVPKEKWGVHQNHCCKHGCKYGYSKCPVELELVEQKYHCESCSSS